MVRVSRTRTSTTSKGFRALAAVVTTAVVGIGTVGVGVVTAGAAAGPTVVAVEVGDTAGLKGPMTMTVTPASAPAGKVKFTVEQLGTIIHEFVVLKTKVPFDKIPVVEEPDQRGEDGRRGRQHRRRARRSRRPSR